MYGTLGFIANGRPGPSRDAAFMGSNGHPARKDMYGAKRPEEAMASKSMALLERRCIFLEEQEKRRGAEIADLRAKLAEAHVETVKATALLPTMQAAEIEGERSEVAAGTELCLQYPMKRIRAGEAAQVWMRRREVDPHLAVVSYSWILIFEEQDAQPDKVFVGEFR